MRNIFGELLSQEYKTTNKQIVRSQVNERKDLKEKPDKINELMLKTKVDLKEGPGNI